MYGSSDMECNGENVLSFWTIFCPFNSLTAQKIKILKKWKKKPGDIIILHMCTKNYDEMICASWDMVHDGCNSFSFWLIFCPFTPVTSRKIKIFKKWKKEKNTWRYHYFTYVYQKLWSDDVHFLRYGVWQM